MSKKMWNKIFKSKSKNKAAISGASSVGVAGGGKVIGKRCSIYEEYQQLNALLQTDKQQKQQQQRNKRKSQLLLAAAADNSLAVTTTNAAANYDERPLPAIVAAAAIVAAHQSGGGGGGGQKPQSTFAKVVNTLTLKRASNQQAKEPATNCGDNKLANGNGYAANTLERKKQQTKKHNGNIASTDAADCRQAAATAQQPPPPPLADADSKAPLHTCPICSRTFVRETLQKHVGICEKMATKRRHVFDSQRQRREGTELAAYPLPKGYGLTPVTVGGGGGGGGAASSTSMRAERGQSPNPQQLASPTQTRKRPTEGDLTRDTVRASMRKRSNSTNSSQQAAGGAGNSPTTPGAGGGGGGNFTRDRMRSSERSLAKRIQAPAAEQCPHCDRCFGVKAYDRHVEWCKEKALQASIKTKQTSRQVEPNVAKERLEARTKYRAPCLKTKRGLNREKYAGYAPDDLSEPSDSPKGNTNNNNNNNTNNSIMSLSMTSSMTSERTQRKPNRTTSSQIIADVEAAVAKSMQQRQQQERQQPQKDALSDDFRSFNAEMARLADDDVGGQPRRTRRELTRYASDFGASNDGVDGGGDVDDIAGVGARLKRVRRAGSDLAASGGDTDWREQLSPSHALRAERTGAVGRAVDGAVDGAAESGGGELEGRRRRRDRQPRSGPINLCTAAMDGDSGLLGALSKRQQQQQQLQQQEMEFMEWSQQGGQLEMPQSVAAAASAIFVPTPRRTTIAATTTTAIPAPRKATPTTTPRMLTTALSLPALAATNLEANPINASTTTLTSVTAGGNAGIIAGCRPKRKQLSRKSSHCGGNNNEPMKATVPLHCGALCPPEGGGGGEPAGGALNSPPPLLRRERSRRRRSHGHSRGAALPENDGDGDGYGDDGVCYIKRPPPTLAYMSAAESLVASPTRLIRSRSFTLCGYDPFLSAKRQLEELCSPTTPSDPYDAGVSPKLHTPTTPNTPLLPLPLPLHAAAKMSTSLTLGASSNNNTHNQNNNHSSPLTPNSAQRRNSNSSTAATAPPAAKVPAASNFRRTSSLRGSRHRAPILPAARPPLFAQKHRPTIQRGLSDEGPISSNFLKPEEYDEMPVRSVCVNDFAITNSPRVVRRDTSQSNRKNSLKLLVGTSAAAGGGGGATTTPPSTATAGGPSVAGEANSSDERLAAAKYLSKTDSLAVFLKYETELEKLAAAANRPVASEPGTASGGTVAATPLISKELKDKSNNLSKQNSAKNIRLGHDEAAPNASPALETPKLSSAAKAPAEATPSHAASRHTPLRLEPISKPATPLLLPLSKPQTPAVYASGRGATLPTLQPAPPVNLSSIFGCDASAKTAKERPNSGSSGEFIDPKLINKCDNLPVSLVGGRSVVLKPADGEPTEPARSQPSSAAPEASLPLQTPPVLPTSYAALGGGKLLPISSNNNNVTANNLLAASAHSPSSATITATNGYTNNGYTNNHNNNTNNNTNNNNTMPINNNSSCYAATAGQSAQRNSGEGRCLLKRKMRLGRNQFLYDASPEQEADSCCSADDESTNPRSSADYDRLPSSASAQTPAATATPTPPPAAQQSSRQRAAPAQLPAPTKPRGNHNLPTLPIFDDFDFEEFLSSFENDEEQFPLFKDCREFLLNRTSSKQQRSMHKPNSAMGISPITTTPTTPQPPPPTTATRHHHNNNNNNSNSRSAYQSPTAHTHFQFPSVALNHNNNNHNNNNICPASLLTGHNHLPPTRIAARHNDSLDTYAGKDGSRPADAGHDVDDDDENDVELGNKKREIFISIETEQSDLGGQGSPPLPTSPDALRRMVGNSQTMVEVETDAKENKFSRISDDDEQAPQQQQQQQQQQPHLPNVQLNNAKNLIQKMQDDFRQLSAEMGANLRQAVAAQNAGPPPVNATSMLYGPGGTGVSGSGATRAGVRTAPAAPGSGAGRRLGAEDSDEMSSLDGYPISSQSSRRGVGSKLSADSAYGSLSRQRSSELSTHRSLSRTRPSTASAITATAVGVGMFDQQPQARQQQQLPPQQHLQQQQQQQQQQQPQHYKYAGMKNRARKFGDDSTSSSSSDNSLPPIHSQHQQLQQQPQQQFYKHNNNGSGMDLPRGQGSHFDPIAAATATTTVSNANLADDLTNANIAALLQSHHQLPHQQSQYSLANSNSLNSSLATMSTSMSMKLSKFCHECGSRFVIEQAKFCMDCGVRRIVL